METTQTPAPTNENQIENSKEKRTYKKLQMNESKLLSFMNEKKVSVADVAKLFEVGNGTAKKYLIDGKLMNGYQRETLCKHLQITYSTLDSLIF